MSEPLVIDPVEASIRRILDAHDARTARVRRRNDAIERKRCPHGNIFACPTCERPDV